MAVTINNIHSLGRVDYDVTVYRNGCEDDLEQLVVYGEFDEVIRVMNKLAAGYFEDPDEYYACISYAGMDLAVMDPISGTDYEVLDNIDYECFGEVFKEVYLAASC